MTGLRSFPMDWPREAAEHCGCPDCLHLIAWVDNEPHDAGRRG